MHKVMLNVLIQVVVEVDADNDAGAKEIAQAQTELTIEECLGGIPEFEYSIIQNNVVWVTESENAS